MGFAPNERSVFHAELARMGNDVCQHGTQKPVQGAAFAEIAKAKSDGFTAKDGGLHDWSEPTFAQLFEIRGQSDLPRRLRSGVGDLLS